MKKGKKSGISSEDAALWQKVAKTIRAYDKPSLPSESSALAAKVTKEACRKTPDSTPPPVRRVAAPTPRPVLTPPTPRFDDGTARDLKKKKWAIDKRIDLHGMTQAAAFEALHRFIMAALKQEKRTLLVITGKGSRSTGGGVLRRMLPMWLADAAFGKHILAVTAARIEDGGDGAFYVRLRKKKP